MTTTPTSAFAWLIEHFRRYTRNQMSWLEVQQVLEEAESLRDEFQGASHPWFGPCDTNLPDGGCSECDAIARGNNKSHYQLMWEMDHRG